MAATDQLQKKLKFRRSCFRNLLCVLFLRAVETGKHALFRRTPSRSCLVRSLNGWLCSLHYLFLLYSPFHPVSLVLFQVTVAFVECSARRVMVQQRIPSAKLLFFFDQANILQNLVPRNVFQDMPHIFAVKGLLYAWFIRNASNASTRPCFGANLPGTKAAIAFGHCRERILLNFIEQT